MGFGFGIILGITFGIGLKIVFIRHEKVRAKRRSELAAVVAAFARMTMQDVRRMFPPGTCPTWVIFHQMQKLKWLNTGLDKLWPNIDVAASALIKSSLEPILEQYRSSILASLKFSKLTLGTVAPHFKGIRVIDGDPGEIIIEVGVQWDGNPNIVLDIKTRLGVVLPVKIKDVGFTGVFRIIFKPLVEEFPCFGAVCYSLREKENFNFNLKIIGGEISAVPGLSDAIDRTIRDALEDSITWPARWIIPIIPGDYGDLELKPCGILEVKLVEAKDLSNKDLIGKSDPFACVYIRPLRNRTKRTKTINNQLNPIWNESFEFLVEDPSTQFVAIWVYDDEGIQPPEPIGCARVALKDLDPGKVKVVWLSLVKNFEVQRDTKNRGQVHLELLYCPFVTENQIIDPFHPDLPFMPVEDLLKDVAKEDASDVETKLNENRHRIILRGVLSVTVVSAENLPVMDLAGKSDPFVIVTLKKARKKMKTTVINKTLDPVWNQNFEFIVEDALRELVIFEVYDHDTIGKDYIGRCLMTLTRVILEGEVHETFTIDGTKNGRLTLHLKWVSLRTSMRDPNGIVSE